MLSFMRDRIEMSQAGERVKDGEDTTGIKSTFPEWYRKADFKSKKALETGEISDKLATAIHHVDGEYNRLINDVSYAKIIGRNPEDEQRIHERTQSQGFGSLIETAQDVIKRDDGSGRLADESPAEAREREA